MNNEEKILAMLERIQQRQEATNTRLDGLEAGQATMQADMNTMKADIEEIKEHTEITRETTNAIGEWTEAAAGALKIKYPVEEI